MEGFVQGKLPLEILSKSDSHIPPSPHFTCETHGTIPSSKISSEVGGETNREIVSFRSCVRALSLSGGNPLKSSSGQFPFSLLSWGAFPFSLLWRELFLFPYDKMKMDR